jgi:type VII secretion integral membrane protein EccD
MTTAYSRVTVVTGSRRVDLALPSALPLADVMPQLLRFSAPDERPETPTAWSVGRVGGPTLSLTRTLGDSGVLDGEVLELRAGPDAVRPAYVEDVRDAVEDAVDASGRSWQPRTTVTFALLVAAAALTGAVLLPEARSPHDGVALGTAVATALLATTGGWWAERRGIAPAAATLLAVAALWGALAGWLAGSFTDASVWTRTGGALLGGLLVTGAARLLTARATAHLAAAFVVTAAAALPAGCAVAGADPRTGLRLAAVLGVLLVGVLPRVSLIVGGLASADYQVRYVGVLDRDALVRRFHRSRAMLHGGVVGVVGTAAVAAYLLGERTGWDRALAVATGAALLLRSRVFSQTPFIVPVRLAGLGVLVVQGLRFLQAAPQLRPWTVALGAFGAALLVGVSAVPLSEVTRARYKQALNIVEMLVIAALVVLLIGALGTYDWVAARSG